MKSTTGIIKKVWRTLHPPKATFITKIGSGFPSLRKNNTLDNCSKLRNWTFVSCFVFNNRIFVVDIVMWTMICKVQEIRYIYSFIGNLTCQITFHLIRACFLNFNKSLQGNRFDMSNQFVWPVIDKPCKQQKLQSLKIVWFYC